MGCGSSVAVSRNDEEGSYVRYDGYGNDYVNYSYYQSYYTNINDNQQDAWNDYYRALEYQKEQDLQPDQQSDDNGYSEYKHWYEQLPQRHSKTFPQQQVTPAGDTKQREEHVNLVIENSSDDLNRTAEDATDSSTPIKLRMGLKTIGTALRITVTKQKPVPSQGPDQLKVTVLDTMRKPSFGFLTHKPVVESGKPFIDKKFTPNVALGKYRSNFMWRRPKDIYPKHKIRLFHDGTSLDDIDQGCFGTCYFLATLAGLASQPEVMKQIILRDAYKANEGVFHCRFWRMGRWIDIYIDDHLPCDADGLVGCKSNNNVGEMWVPLIEKAYAKFVGSYPDVEGGTPRDAYLALTGGSAEWLALSYYKFDSAAVYSRLANALRHGSVVVCSATPKEASLKSEVQEKGIILNHAYTVTASAVVERDEGMQESLIKLRNPWSHKEWLGAWSDESSDWYSVNESQRMQLREIEDDGEFWMPWTEFWRIFTDLTVCSITPDYDCDGLADGLDNVFCIYGQWKGKLTGGWQEVENNPKYEFTVSDDAKEPVYVLVESLQKLPPRVHKTSAGNILLKDVKTSSLDTQDKYLGADSLTYSTANPLTRRFQVKPGGTYQLIPTKYESGEEGSYLLRIFSKQSLQIEPVGRSPT